MPEVSIIFPISSYLISQTVQCSHQRVERPSPNRKDTTMDPKAYLQITMFIDADKRPAAAKVFFNYLQPFLGKIEGALTKELLAHDEDV